MYMCVCGMSLTHSTQAFYIYLFIKRWKDVLPVLPPVVLNTDIFHGIAVKFYHKKKCCRVSQ